MQGVQNALFATQWKKKGGWLTATRLDRQAEA
jgi:hypothetical protein